MFDVYRSWSTERLEARRRAVIGEQRRLHAEELAIVRVLDERGRIDPTIGSAGESAQRVREKVETARALEELPAIADVAMQGGFSDEQLSSVVQLADGASDREWATLARRIAIGTRAPALSPKTSRAVLLRDGRCRVPGCVRRRGLQVHHLVPRSWQGTDDISNLAAVCPAHHRLLVPHGLLALVGNPNLPDGLELVTASRAPPRAA
jgi:hypothetical protein